jgi:hypothetical protein
MAKLKGRGSSIFIGSVELVAETSGSAALVP